MQRAIHFDHRPASALAVQVEEAVGAAPGLPRQTDRRRVMARFRERHHNGRQTRRRGCAGRPAGARASRVAADADRLAGMIRNAGAIFIGAHTPEAIGDYVAGSNHVLPTARSARFSSGLGVLDFMKRTSLLVVRP